MAQFVNSRKREIAIFRFWVKIIDFWSICVPDRCNIGLSSYVEFFFNQALIREKEHRM